ncbi:MAG: DNA-methyltransferase [Patescibacteria group bacterium UBA2163]
MNTSLETKQRNLIKQGDIFSLGNHLVACGDCRDKEFVATVIGARKVVSVNIDPPYGVGLVENAEGFKALLKNKVIESDHLQSNAEYRQFSREWIAAIKPHLERKNSFYIFNSDKMLFALRDAMLDEGLKFAQLLVWVKTSAVVGRLDYAPQHELILYGWHGTHTFKKSKDKSVLVFPKPSRSPHHPSTKPTSLIRRLILNSTSVGDVVYDGFLGSGTCLISCEQTKRSCIGIEIDPEYCQTAIERWEKLTGETAKKINKTNS